jgi:4-aminobutyrate aminotransferase
MRNFQYFPLVIKEAKGSIIADLDDNKFIDFLSSASSLNLGNSNPIINKAIINQLNKFSQYCIGYIANEQVIEYAKLLTSVYPGGIKAKVSFANSGSEANDTAIKFARAYTGRQKLISFINGYHGSTYGAISISSCTNKMKNGLGPFLPEVFFFPFYGNILVIWLLKEKVQKI